MTDPYTAFFIGIPATGGDIDDIVFDVLIALFIVAAGVLLIRLLSRGSPEAGAGAERPLEPTDIGPAEQNLPNGARDGKPIEEESDLRSAGAA